MAREPLGRMLRGDLSPIVLKALENDPERRYESVRAFAGDIENYLAGHPVLARPQTALYRAGKFVRRRWAAVSAATIFAVGLSSAAMVAVNQTRTARAEALKAEKVSRFLSNMLSSGTRLGTGYTVAQMLDAAEPELEKSWQDDPLTEATLRMNLGASYTSLQQPGRAAFQSEKALALFQARGDHRGAAIALWILGQNAESSGRLNRAVHYYEQSMESLDHLRKRDGPPLWEFRVKRDLGRTLSWVSSRRLDEANALLTRAIARAAGDPTIPGVELADAYSGLGRILADQGRDQEAETAFQQAMSSWRQSNHDGDFEPVLRGRMLLKSRQHDFRAASELARLRYQVIVKGYSSDHRWAAQCQLDWARYRAETGEIEEAMAQARAAMTLVVRDPRLGESLCWPLLAASHVLVRAGQFDEAERNAREALKVVDEGQREEADSVRAESLELIGTALKGEKKYREAKPVLEHAQSIYQQLGRPWTKSAVTVGDLLAQVGESAK